MILRMQGAGGPLQMNIPGPPQILTSQSSLMTYSTEQRNREGLCMKWGGGGGTPRLP